MPEKDCRTVALEVGLQNAGLGSGLALAMGKLSTVGLAPAIFTYNEQYRLHAGVMVACENER